jgi:hypothetical protein
MLRNHPFGLSSLISVLLILATFSLAAIEQFDLLAPRTEQEPLKNEAAPEQLDLDTAIPSSALQPESKGEARWQGYANSKVELEPEGTRRAPDIAAGTKPNRLRAFETASEDRPGGVPEEKVARFAAVENASEVASADDQSVQAAVAARASSDAVSTQSDVSVSGARRDKAKERVDAHFVQLGAGSREADAYVAADRLSRDLEEILQGVKIDVVRGQKDADTIYRLLAGPFPTSAESNRICGEVSLIGGDCFVIEGALPALVNPGGDVVSAETQPRKTTAPASPGGALPPRAGQAKAFATLAALNYRKGPSESAIRLGTLPEATFIRVVSESDGWAKVLLQDGRVVYVSRRFIRPVE